MRKTTIALLSLGLAAVLASPAMAVNLLTEFFAYPNGNLAGNGGWTIHSGAGTDIQVVSGRAVGSMLQAPDDNTTFPVQSPTSKVYACFNAIIPNPGAAPPDTNYFAHLKDTGTSNLMARVWVGASGNTFKFGLTPTSCACTNDCVPVFWATPLAYDTDYRIVISYDGATGNAELWVNPINEASPKIVMGGGSIGTVSLSSFALRQSNSPPTTCPSGSFAWGFSVDNVGVGTSFADACVSDPTPTRNQTWGQMKTIYR